MNQARRIVEGGRTVAVATAAATQMTIEVGSVWYSDAMVGWYGGGADC